MTRTEALIPHRPSTCECPFGHGSSKLNSSCFFFIISFFFPRKEKKAEKQAAKDARRDSRKKAKKDSHQKTIDATNDDDDGDDMGGNTEERETLSLSAALERLKGQRKNKIARAKEAALILRKHKIMMKKERKRRQKAHDEDPESTQLAP